MIVTDERTLDTFLGDTFLEVSDESLPDRVLETLRAQGIDPAAAGLSRDILTALIESRVVAEPTGPKAQPVQPQARRKALRSRLEESSRVVAMRICHATGLSPAGRKISIKLGAPNDLAAVIRLMHDGVNRFLGIPAKARRDLTTEQIESALDNLESIADEVEDNVRERIA
jgi:hypothetical protein